MQGFAKDFNMMLLGMLLSALGSSVFQILPIPILSDMLPPEQVRCASKGVYRVHCKYSAHCKAAWSHLRLQDVPVRVQFWGRHLQLWRIHG